MSYVDPDFGNDANDGSLNNPFASLDHAVAVYDDPDRYEWIIILPEATKDELITGRNTLNIFSNCCKYCKPTA